MKIVTVGSFPKATVNLRFAEDLLGKGEYRDLIKQLSDPSIIFLCDSLGNKGFFYFSEQSPLIFEYGEVHRHDNVDVYRKLRLPLELERIIEDWCIIFPEE